MEEEIRELLRSMAGEVPPHRDIPPRTLRRTRRRASLTIGVGAVVVSGIAVAAFAGLRTLTGAKTGPNSSIAEPKLAVFDVRWVPSGNAIKIVGVVKNRSGRTSGVLVRCTATDPRGNAVGESYTGIDFLRSGEVSRFPGETPLWRPNATVASVGCNASPVPALTPRPGPEATPHTAKVGPVSPRFVPRAISFWDERHGLVVGSVPPGEVGGCPTSCLGLVAVTLDGGRTWRVTFRSPSELSGLAVFGDGDAWVAAEDGGLQIRSRGGGQNWQPLPSGPPALSSLSFVTPDLGWATADAQTGEERVLESTNDGGATWHQAPAPCPRGWDVTGVSFVTLRQGWLLCTGEPGAGSKDKSIFRTANGGHSWVLVAGTRPRGHGRHRNLRGFMFGGHAEGISFLRDGRGWLRQLGGSSYQTVDGGRTWNAMSVTEPGVVEPESIWFVSDRSGFALLTDYKQKVTRLVGTEDGGLTWTPIQTWPLPG
jgi:photosystem II stability/assembly factor-like uncharacterized protein